MRVPAAPFLSGLGVADSVAQPITGQWQPRLSFVFQLGELGSQRIFGSAGRYYLQLPLLGSSTKLTIRGILRKLREVVGYGLLPPDNAQIAAGNTGRGELGFLPEPTRDYSALELTLDELAGRRLRYLVSYVLSRTHGNYSGQYVGDHGIALPGSNEMLQLEAQGTNSTGLLPNDRPHVFRLFGSYAFDFGLTAGAFFTAQSGTPLNEFGATDVAYRQVALVPRGTAGRTSTIWDLNLRFTYDFGGLVKSRFAPRVFLDLQHLGNPQEVVLTDQTRYLAIDEEGNQTAPNPTFDSSLNHQPPQSLTLGVEVGF